MGVSEPLIQASLLGEAIEHAPVAVLVADEHGKYVAVNQAACVMLGYEREDLLSKHVADIARYGAAHDERNEMREGGARTGTSQLTCKDGTVVDFTYTAGATTVAGMPVVVSVGLS